MYGGQVLIAETLSMPLLQLSVRKKNQCWKVLRLKGNAGSRVRTRARQYIAKRGATGINRRIHHQQDGFRPNNQKKCQLSSLKILWFGWIGCELLYQIFVVMRTFNFSSAVSIFYFVRGTEFSAGVNYHNNTGALSPAHVNVEVVKLMSHDDDIRSCRCFHS